MLTGVQQFIDQCLNTNTHTQWSQTYATSVLQCTAQAGISQINTRAQPYLPFLPPNFQTVLSLEGRMDKYTHTYIVFRRSRALDSNKRPPHGFPFKSLSLPPSLYHYPPPISGVCIASQDMGSVVFPTINQSERSRFELHNHIFP